MGPNQIPEVDAEAQSHELWGNESSPWVLWTEVVLNPRVLHPKQPSSHQSGPSVVPYSDPKGLLTIIT
jgi:hypothetical protein